MKYSPKSIIHYSLIVVMLGAFVSPAAHAMPTDYNFYSSNNILYYDPNAERCDISSSSATSVAGEAQASAGLSALQAGFVDKYREIAVKLSIEYGIPWETPVAQGILESASGTSNFAVERNNFFGIGAFDSNPDNAFRYPTPEAGWRGYFENIRKTPTYREHGAFNHADDPIGYLVAIKEAGYATDPAYISKVTTFIKAIQNRAFEQSWDTSKEVAQKNPVIYENAEKNGAGASASPTSTESTSSTTTACSPTSSPTGELQAGGITTAAGAVPLLNEFVEYVRSKTGSSIPSVPASADFNVALGTPGQNFSEQCDGLSCGQCTALSMWFVNNKTGYSSLGRGNGSAVVANLAEVNRDMGLQVGTTPKPYSIFSWSAGGGGAGHTGVVIGVLDDGSIITIDNNYVAEHELSINKYSKSDYTSKNTTFAYVGDKLK